MVEAKKPGLLKTIVILAGGVYQSIFGGGCSTAPYTGHRPAINPDTGQKEPFRPPYMDYGPFEYPGRVFKDADARWKDGDGFGAILTDIGGVLGVLNDCVEYPVVGALDLFDGSHRLSDIIRFAADGLPGGETSNRSVGYVFPWKNPKTGETEWMPLRALTYAYEVERDGFLGTVKSGEIFAPIAAGIRCACGGGDGGGAAAVAQGRPAAPTPGP